MKNDAPSPPSELVALTPWDAEEALTWVTYGFFRHLKNQTHPADAELSDWWNQLLAVQVALDALVTACGDIPMNVLSEPIQTRLSEAISRVSAAPAWAHGGIHLD